MSEQWPAPTPRDEMLARVIVRGRRIRLVNRLLLGAAIGGAVVAGAVGVGLGVSGALSDGGPAGAVTRSALAYYLCPATGAAGELHDGDRVLVTGVDESGDWLQVRDPASLDRRVWVQREYVDPDRELEVPVADCSTEVRSFESADPAPTTTTTETTLPSETTEPEVPEETTTTTSPATTTTAPTTTTTTAPTTTTTTAPAPVIGAITRSPATIIEDWVGYPGTCNGPTTSSISVPISNASSATMSWNVGPQPRSTSMSAQGGVFSAILGPFDETVVASGNVTITVTITAVGPGGQATKQTTVRLDDCPFG
jgi:hypothetical protein